MAITDAHSLPLAIYATSAQCHEASLVLPALKARLTITTPRWLLADKQYDSDPLDAYLREERKIILIAPNRGIKRPPLSRRYKERFKHRWSVERFFAWLQHFRRLIVRYEYYILNFEGFLTLACVLIYLRHL